MRFNVQHLNIHSLDSLNEWMEHQICALGATRQIDEANVRLVHMHDASPAYQVHVHLVTHGPDVFAEGCDHTLRAAFSKAMLKLREQIAGRVEKRVRRLKRNSTAPAARTRATRPA